VIVTVAGVSSVKVIAKLSVVVHLAQYVVFTLGTILLLVICVPPVLALVSNQPAKVNPVLAFGVGNVPKAAPGVRFDVVGDPVPPL